MVKFYEWFGVIVGIAGSLLLAVQSPFSKYGFIAYLFGNAALVCYAYNKKANGLFLMYSVYLVISIIGIVSWFK